MYFGSDFSGNMILEILAGVTPSVLTPHSLLNHNLTSFLGTCARKESKAFRYKG